MRMVPIERVEPLSGKTYATFSFASPLRSESGKLIARWQAERVADQIFSIIETTLANREADVAAIVENFIFLNNPPFQIITGNSKQMKSIVTRVLRQHKYKFEIGDYFNQGYIKVTR